MLCCCVLTDTENHTAGMKKVVTSLDVTLTWALAPLPVPINRPINAFAKSKVQQIRKRALTLTIPHQNLPLQSQQNPLTTHHEPRPRATSLGMWCSSSMDNRKALLMPVFRPSKSTIRTFRSTTALR